MLAHLSGTICLKHSATLILPPLLKPPSRRSCLITISKLFFAALPIPSSDTVCVCVVSVIVKSPVLPPSVVDGCSRNPLYYYYYYTHRCIVAHTCMRICTHATQGHARTHTYTHTHRCIVAHACLRICTHARQWYIHTRARATLHVNNSSVFEELATLLFFIIWDLAVVVAKFDDFVDVLCLSFHFFLFPFSIWLFGTVTLASRTRAEAPRS